MLYLISTPIGHIDDITIRAVKYLQICPYLVAESYKIGRFYQKKYNQNSELLLLNEHSTDKDIELITKLIIDGHDVALISDGGTPNFEDPGGQLINQLIKSGEYKKIKAIPGVSSITMAISLCPFDLSKFFYLGFLAREPEIRKKELASALLLQQPLIIYDTAYRLKALIQDLKLVIKKDKKIFLGLDLTGEHEYIIVASIDSIIKIVAKLTTKLNFVLIINK